MNKFHYYIVEGGHDQDPDPEQLGRIRARKMGAHGEGVQTSHLPFSQLVSPSSGTGMDEFNRPPQPGSIVLGIDASEASGYIFPLGILHGKHESGATVPGNDAMPFLGRASSMVSQFMQMVPDIQTKLESNKTGIQKVVKEITEKGGSFSQALNNGIPTHGAPFALTGLRNTPLEKIQTALDQATSGIGSDMLKGLGSPMNLGSMLGNLNIGSLGLSSQLTESLNAMKNLMPQDKISQQPEWGSMFGNLTSGGPEGLQEMASKLGNIQNFGELSGAIQSMQAPDFLGKIQGQLSNIINIETPFGNLQQILGSNGSLIPNIENLQGIADQIQGFLGSILGILQGGSGKKLFTDKGLALPEMLGRMKDFGKQSEMKEFLEQLSNINISKNRGRTTGTTGGNNQAARQAIMEVKKQVFSTLDNFQVPFKPK